MTVIANSGVNVAGVDLRCCCGRRRPAGARRRHSPTRLRRYLAGSCSVSPDLGCGQSGWILSDNHRSGTYSISQIRALELVGITWLHVAGDLLADTSGALAG